MNSYRKELIFRFCRTFSRLEFMFRARGYHQYKKGNRPHACWYEKQFVYDYLIGAVEVDQLELMG